MAQETDESLAEQIRYKLSEVDNLAMVLRERGYDVGARFGEHPRFVSEFWATKTHTVAL